VKDVEKAMAGCLAVASWLRVAFSEDHCRGNATTEKRGKPKIRLARSNIRVSYCIVQRWSSSKNLIRA